MSSYSLKIISTELGDFFADPELINRPITDTLKATVIFVENGSEKWCLISADTTELNTRDTKKIRIKAAEILDIDHSNLWITFSHTHSATWGEGFDVEKFSASICRAVEKIKNTLAQSIDSVALLTVDTGDQFTVNRRAYVDGIGSFSAYQNVNCEDDGQKVNAAGWARQELIDSGADENEVNKITQAYLDGPADGVLQLLLFGMKEQPMAGIVRFNAHSVILSSGYYKPHFSRDYCGMLVDNLSETWNCPILFMQGPAGNQRTRHTDNTPECCTEFSKKLAAELSCEKLNPRWKPIDSFKATNQLLKCSIHDWLKLSPDEINKRIEQLQSELKSLEKDSQYLAKFKKLSDELKIMQLAGPIKESLLYIDQGNVQSGTVDFEISGVRFGPLKLITSNGELGNFFSLKLYEKFGVENMVVTAYTNGCDGYLIEKEDFDRGGYESAASVIKPENTDQILASACNIIEKFE